MNKINQLFGKHKRIAELCEMNGEILRDLHNIIPTLMNILWEQPEIVATIIENTDIKDLKKHLAPLFVNNFFENVFSSYYTEENLMYVLTLLIKSEINKLKDINQKETFLNNSPCGIMLEKLIKKADIEDYFNKITKDVVENIETDYSKNKIIFEPDEIVISLKNFSDWDIIDKNEGNKLDNFNKNYKPILDESVLKKLIEENKKNKNIYDYLNSKLICCEKDKEFFSNKKILNFISKYKDPEILLIEYQKNLYNVIKYINQIIKNILNNLHLIPYSIKCLCEIISGCITKKFNSINTHDKNAFIAKFFFEKLLIPFILSSIKNNYNKNISLQNLQIICKLLQKFVSCDFFNKKESDYIFTPFNWYFINNIRDIFNISQNITKVKLPPFLEDLINNKLPSDYKYDYFKENSDEVINCCSILFNIKQIDILCFSIKASEKIIFSNNKNIEIQKIIEKLMQIKNQELIQNIIKSEKEIKMKKKNEEEYIYTTPIIHYFLVTSIYINPRYVNLMNIKTKDNFSTELNKDSSIKKLNIKVKQYLSNLLFNLPYLKISDLDKEAIDCTENIIKELNNINDINESSYIKNDDSIPNEWYIESLLKDLKYLPDYLVANDYEELYNELEKNINKSIKEFDFEFLGEVKEKIKFSNMKKIYYEKRLEFFEDFEINKKTKKIIKEHFIPVDLIFELKNNECLFRLKLSSFKEKDIDSEEKKLKYESSNKVKLSLTIENFPKNFPNFVKYQEMKDRDIIKMQEKLKVHYWILNYMETIRESLKNNKVINIDKIMDKIYDYIMEKIYDKIFPIEPSEEDNKIFQKSILLNWIKLKHLIKTEEESEISNLEAEASKYLRLCEKEKNPRKKLAYIQKIFISIKIYLKLKGRCQEINDDNIIGRILTYIIIKSQCQHLNNNIRFTELYMGDKKKIEGDQFLSQFKSTLKMIPGISHSDLIDVTSEEFTKNCQNEKRKKK